MRTLYDGMSFEVIREAAAFNNGIFSTNWSTGQVTANNSSQVRDGGRYRWIGEDSTNNDRYRYVGETESSLKPRYIGIQVTLYGRGEPVAMNRTSSANGRGGTTYFGKDILGSVRSVTNESGQLEDRYEYDAFGKPYQGDLDNGMNLGYMGKPYDSNTGLYNYGYRDYKPEAARFTTVDPIRDGSNWFVYVNSDPVNYTDLWGLEKILTISVNQPGNGGDRDTFEYTGGQNFDTGHAFVTLTDTETGETTTKGFYPDYSTGDKPLNVLVNQDVPGKVVDDSNYDKSKIDVTSSFSLSDVYYSNAQQYIETIERNTPAYNLSDFNCTDFVINTAATAGIDIPQTKGTWPTGSGLNPGDLGEDLRTMN